MKAREISKLPPAPDSIGPQAGEFLANHAAVEEDVLSDVEAENYNYGTGKEILNEHGRICRGV